MDEDEQFVKPNNKKYNRRSSFFRRSLCSFNSDSPASNGTREAISQKQEEVIITQDNKKANYLSKLRKELDDWKTLEDRKKKELEELKERRSRAVLSDDLLTAEDKKILKNRPDYVAIGRLLGSVTETVAIKQLRINNTYKKVYSLVENCEQVTCDAVGNLIEYFMESFDEFSDIALKERFM